MGVVAVLKGTRPMPGLARVEVRLGRALFLPCFPGCGFSVPVPASLAPTKADLDTNLTTDIATSSLFHFFDSVSYNGTSLGQYTSTGPGHASRLLSTRRHVINLANSHHLTAAQETKLSATERRALQSSLPGSTIFYNNDPGNSGPDSREFSAGTLLIANPVVSRLYLGTALALPPELQGHSLHQQGRRFPPPLPVCQ
jgi:hypothetical protein